MTQPQRNSALVTAIVCGLLSFPMTWMTIRNVTLDNGFGGLPMQISGITLQMTGFNGSVKFLVSSPLWFIILIAIAANVLQLMKNTAQFEIPQAAKSITAVIAAIWTTVPVLLSLFSGDATPGLGWVLGMVCAITPLYILFTTPSTDAHGTSDEDDPDV